MSKISHDTFYTTEAALEYAFKKIKVVSFKDPRNHLLRRMNAKKIKVVIKVFETDECD